MAYSHSLHVRSHLVYGPNKYRNSGPHMGIWLAALYFIDEIEKKTDEIGEHGQTPFLAISSSKSPRSHGLGFGGLQPVMRKEKEFLLMK